MINYKYISIFLITVLIQFGFSQQTLSPYLQNPEKAIGFADSSASFWFDAYDDVYGGFFHDVNRIGQPFGSYKATLSQTRNAYGFTRAFMLTGDTLYLNYARKALDYMYENAWDENWGGWYIETNEQGNPSNPNAFKTAFNEHYALLGISAYYEATGDTLDWQWLERGYNHIEDKLWDDRLGFEGYFDQGYFNWALSRGKSFNATVDAVTTHLLSLYLQTKEQKYLDRLRAVAANMQDYLIANMDANAIGFPEVFGSDWEERTSENRTIMGHVLKTGWCLARIQQVDPSGNYLIDAEKAVQGVLDKGYDHEFGGPYKDYDRFTGEMFMYGIPDTAKAWWQMEQAITAGLQLYHLTGDVQYLEVADETTDFFMKHFVDHEYGEIYADTKRNGDLIQQWGTNKGSPYKAAYHSVETGYYIYLYGKLLLHNEPATLYYKYDALDYPREILLNPIAINDSLLSIESITKDGIPYTNFDAKNRILYLPENEAGIFAVTYTSIAPITSIAGEGVSLPSEFILMQNYPNPFNPSTKIQYQIGENSDVKLSIFNVLGENVEVLVNQRQQQGSYEVNFNASELPSGVYFYQLEANGFVQTRKMMLLK